MYQILIADDDPNIRIGLCQMLSDAFSDRINVISCENGYIAFQELQKNILIF